MASDKDNLTTLARQVFQPGQVTLRVDDNTDPTVDAPYSITVSLRADPSKIAVQPFTGQNLRLACQLCATRLGIALKP